MIKINKKEKILILAVFGIISIFIAERVFLSGLRKKFSQMQQQVKYEEARLKRNLEIQREKDRILMNYKNYQNYLKSGPVDEGQVVAELLKEIERLAKESGASIINLSPQEEAEQAPSYKKFKADLRLEASMEQIISFLYKIQESKSLIKIERISLSPKDEQATILKVEALVSMAVLL